MIDPAINAGLAALGTNIGLHYVTPTLMKISITRLLSIGEANETLLYVTVGLRQTSTILLQFASVIVIVTAPECSLNPIASAQ